MSWKELRSNLVTLSNLDWDEEYFHFALSLGSNPNFRMTFDRSFTVSGQRCSINVHGMSKYKG